jgi:hypothetical protein
VSRINLRSGFRESAESESNRRDARKAAKGAKKKLERAFPMLRAEAEKAKEKSK